MPLQLLLWLVTQLQEDFINMATTNFINQQTVIQADWLNDVNNMTYVTGPGYSTSISALNSSKANAGANTDITSMGTVTVPTQANATANTTIANTLFVSNKLAAIQTASKNKLINSNFSINQRGVSGTVTLAAGVYGHDRWKAGAGGCTYTFATTANVTTITITAGTLQQVVEGAQLFSGTHCLSWTGTATGRIDAGSYSASGVTGTATGGTNMTVEFGTGTLSLVQLEQAGIPSAWNIYNGLYGGELQACQRYYETIDARHFNYEMYSLSGGLAAHINQQFKVTKRAVPTITQPTPASQAASSGLTVTGTISGIDFTWTAGSGVAFVLFTAGNLFTAAIEL
jgi:hypothetical protein